MDQTCEEDVSSLLAYRFNFGITEVQESVWAVFEKAHVNYINSQPLILHQCI